MLFFDVLLNNVKMIKCAKMYKTVFIPATFIVEISYESKKVRYGNIDRTRQNQRQMKVRQRAVNCKVAVGKIIE